MNNPIIIAVDAMGGDDSPNKVIKGISIHSKTSENIKYKIFGKRELIIPLIKEHNIQDDKYDLIHTDNIVSNEDTALSAAKKGKDTSLWLSIESVKNNQAHAIISAGNTGALFLISKLNLNMIKNIDKPALSALWPSKKGMSVVLDLGANIDAIQKFN